MILDYIAHLKDGAVLRAHLLAVSDEIAALHSENAALRTRMRVQAAALELCRTAASAAAGMPTAGGRGPPAAPATDDPH